MQFVNAWSDDINDLLWNMLKCFLFQACFSHDTFCISLYRSHFALYRYNGIFHTSPFQKHLCFWSITSDRSAGICDILLIHPCSWISLWPASGIDMLTYLSGVTSFKMLALFAMPNISSNTNCPPCFSPPQNYTSNIAWFNQHLLSFCIWFLEHTNTGGSAPEPGKFEMKEHVRN